jgi:geranylgeranyl reductase family protein
VTALGSDTPQTADVVVVGGGPAGAAAAITLARAGRDVVVVDKARFPRDKCCGDGLTADALRILERLGLDPSSVATWQPVDDVVVRSPSGYETVLPLPRELGWFGAVAQRRDLDAALLDVARAAGAKVLDGHALTGAQQHGDRVVIEVDGIGAIHCRYAIGADGMWSPLRKAVDAVTPGYRGECHAFRQYFTNVTGPAAERLFIWFEPDVLPGYAWSFPLPGGRANVGFGIHRDGRRVAKVQQMKKIWSDIVERPHVRAALGAAARPEAPHKAWPIGARIDTISLSAGRVLFVGDAAAAADALTGEGIGQALRTGILAARAIDTAGPVDAAAATASYERDVRAGFVADHVMSRALIHVVRHRKSTRAAMRMIGANPWTRRNTARWLFEDYPRGVITTPQRWHAGMFTGPGAYRTGRATRSRP